MIVSVATIKRGRGIFLDSLHIPVERDVEGHLAAIVDLPKKVVLDHLGAALPLAWRPAGCLHALVSAWGIWG